MDVVLTTTTDVCFVRVKASEMYCVFVHVRMFVSMCECVG